MGELVAFKSNEIITADDVEVLRNSKFKGFTDAEIKYACQVSSHLQLNPLLNQVHFVKRENRRDGTATITTQVGIDGFRLAAERTGKYAGSDEPIFEGGDKKPTKATVTVYKMMEGQRCAFTASARWEEYCPSPPNDAMWKRMPCNQLAKCAEALALRKAFPAELSAIRTDEEMEQANGPVPASKASILNSRPPANVIEGEIVESEAVVSEPEPVTVSKPVEQAGPPMCCNKKMMLSKFPNRDGERAGKIDWYCHSCQGKRARE